MDTVLLIRVATVLTMFAIVSAFLQDIIIFKILVIIAAIIFIFCGILTNNTITIQLYIAVIISIIYVYFRDRKN